MKFPYLNDRQLLKTMWRGSRPGISAATTLTAVCFASILVTGCATFQTSSSDSKGDSKSASQNSTAEDVPAPKSLTEVLQQDINSPQLADRSSGNNSSAVQKGIVVENGEIIVEGVKLKNTRFDIPVAVNSRVEYWINYFCGRGRGFFERYLERSEYFVPYIVPLLKQNGLPEDLVYLAMIESGFNNLARSRAKAVGPWQFISATGKRYGLMVNWWVDERRDTGKATLAAVGYLKDLYMIFQSWELAAAAYNAGEAKIARAVRRFGSKDFWEISRHRFLKPETRDYVPKIIAAAMIAKNRAQFGFPEQNVKPGEGEAVASDGEVVKLIKADKEVEDKDYQAEKEDDLKKGAIKTAEVADLGDDGDFDTDDDDSDAIAQTTGGQVVGGSKTANMRGNGQTVIMLPVSGSMPLAKPIQTPHVSKSGQVGGEELADFEVQSPADLLKIARAAGLSYQTVKSLNPEILRWCTPPTVGTFRVKLPAFAKDKFLMTYNHEAFPRKVQFMTYKVHRGDTLARIARHFGIKVDPISDLNGVPPQMPLRSGAKVLLPMPNDRSRTFASLEVRDPPEKSRRHRHRRYRHGSKNYKAESLSRGNHAKNS